MFGNTLHVESAPVAFHIVTVGTIVVGLVGSTVMSLVQLFG